jgi:hypothetical protein
MDILVIFSLFVLYLLAGISFVVSYKINKFCHVIPPKLDYFEDGVMSVYSLTDKMQAIVLIHEQQINELAEQIHKINVEREKEGLEIVYNNS